MRRVQLGATALATLGAWMGQGLLLFGLAAHVAEDHQHHPSASVDLASALHGHDHAEGSPDHSHETLPAPSAGVTSKQMRYLSLGVVSFVSRPAVVSFASEPQSPDVTPAGMRRWCLPGAQADTRPPLHDILCILLI
jgi:hypothetical protein